MLYLTKHGSNSVVFMRDKYCAWFDFAVDDTILSQFLWLASELSSCSFVDKALLCAPLSKWLKKETVNLSILLRIRSIEL
jgi:hypothetical protein